MLLNFVGRLGTLPEKRVSKNGVPYYNFPVAFSEYRNGENVTVWVHCYLWNMSYENFVQKLAKGSCVEVCGDLTFKGFLDKENNPQCSLSVTVFYMRYAMTNNSNNADVANNSKPNTPSIDDTAIEIPKSYKKVATAEAAKASSSASYDDGEDDLPF